MGEPFDAALFVSRMQAGVFDGKLHEELASLSREQLEQVAELLNEELRRRHG